MAGAVYGTICGLLTDLLFFFLTDQLPAVKDLSSSYGDIRDALRWSLIIIIPAAGAISCSRIAVRAIGSSRSAYLSALAGFVIGGVLGFAVLWQFESILPGQQEVAAAAIAIMLGTVVGAMGCAVAGFLIGKQIFSLSGKHDEAR